MSPAAVPSTPAVPPDAIGQARQQAKTTGEPVHIPSLDTASTTTYVDPDQMFTTSLSSGPVRAMTPSGWQPIDTTLVSDGSGVHPKVAANSIVFSAGGSGPLVSLSRPTPAGETSLDSSGQPTGTQQLSFAAPGVLPAPVLSANTASYAGLVPGADVVLSATATGFELSLVFHQAPATVPVIDLPLTVSGLALSQAANGDLILADSTGKIIAHASAPEMFDATVAPGGSRPHEQQVATTLVSEPGGGQVLRLAPDPGFFSDPATVYPVTVDPSATLGDSLNNYVDRSNPTINNDTSAYLDAGPSPSGDLYRSFVAFADQAIKGKNIASASLSVDQWASNSCTPTPRTVQGSTPLAAGSTWNTQPGLDGTVWGSVNTAGGFASPPGCQSGGGYETIAITGLVAEWAATPATTTDTLGIVAGNENDPTQGKGLFSDNTGNSAQAPSVSVTYYTTPNTPTGLAPPAGTVEDTLDPTLSGTVSGGDGGELDANFTVTDTTTGVQAASYSTLVNPGTDAMYTVPANLLQLGDSFTWTFTACEGLYPYYYCSTSATSSFVADPALAAGDRPYFTYESHPISASSSLKVNVASGNLEVSNSDLHIAGTGEDLNISRTYNSVSGQGGAFGPKWTGSPTDMERLVADPGGAVTLYDAQGTPALITPNPGSNPVTYATPAELDASAVFYDGAFIVTYHHSSGDHAAGEQAIFAYTGQLDYLEDHNGNHINVNNNSAGTEVTQTVDTQGRPVNYSYNGSGQLTGINDPNGNRSLVYGYDANGNLSVDTDAAGSVTRYSYNGAHDLTGIVDGAGHVVNIGYDTRNRVTSLSYVVAGVNQTTTYAYTAGQPPNIDGKTVVTDANGHLTTYSFDNADRVILAADAAGQAQATSFDNDSNVIVIKDPAGNTTKATFDGNDNQTSLSLPTGAKNTFTYNDANTADDIHAYELSAATDAQGNTTSYTLDNWGHPTATQNPDGTTTAATYDEGSTHCAGLTATNTGEICTVTDANHNNTTYTYTPAGTLSKITPPGPRQPTSATVDTVSRPTTVTDGTGATTSYSYNGDDQVTGQSYTGGLVETTGYDGDGNVTSTAKNTPAQASTDSYDGAGRLTATTGPTGNVSYGYDPEGNLTTLTDPGGTTRYAYTNVNKVASVTDATGAVTAYTYTPSHDTWPQTIAYPNKVTQTIGYDTSGRTTSMTAYGPTNNILAQNTYSYTTGSGDTTLRQSVTNTQGTTSYGYDPLNRVTSASTKPNGNGPTGSYSYTYDSDGNRTSTTVVAPPAPNTTSNYTYNSADELTSGAATYNGRGDLTSTTGYNLASLSTNPADQTTSITPAGGTAAAQSFAHTDQNAWLASGADSFSTDGTLGISTATLAGTTWDYTRAPDGTLISERNGSTTYYYIFDGAGNVTGLTNPAGQLANTYNYDPYGNQIQTFTPITNPFTYQAGFYDTQTGLYKYGQRYYDPTLGQWTQTDPASDGSTTGTYVYAGDNPTNNADPSGQCIFGHVHGSHSACRGSSELKHIGGDFEATAGVTLLSAGNVFAPEAAPAIIPLGLSLTIDGSCSAGLTLLC